MPDLGAKVVGVRLRRGDRIGIRSPGGGGYGDPADRDPAAVARDVDLGYVSSAHAQEEYDFDPTGDLIVGGGS